MTIEAIIFGLDNTLLEEEESTRIAFLAACERAYFTYGIDRVAFHQVVRKKCQEFWSLSPVHLYCQTVGISPWDGLWARFTGKDENLKILRNWSPVYRQKSWNAALKEHGWDAVSTAERLSETFQNERRKYHLIYPDVVPNLATLHKKYQLALLTNGAPDLQREKIVGSKLRSFFDVIVVSGDIEIGKPDPAIFSMTLNKLGVRSENTVMVGNSLNSDIRGGIKAGLKTIWLNRQNKNQDGLIIADKEISNLNEIYEHL